MAFPNPFKRDFNKPGPGVPKNAPKKTGFPRFREVLSRDFGNLVKLNLIVFATMLPALILFVISLFLYLAGGVLLSMIFGVAALLLSFPVGPSITTMCHLLIKMLRDVPGFLWHDFKRLFKSNFRQMALPGMLFSGLLGAQVYALFTYFSLEQSSLPLTVMFFLSVFLLALIGPYFFAQAAYVDLTFLPLLQNSIMLALGYLPRSLAGAVLGSGLIAVQVLFFPLPLLITIFFGITVPCLINMMWIWPPMDKTFKIDETLKERHEGEFDIETEVQE